MSSVAIKVENISKKYQIGEAENYPTLRDKLMELPNRIFKGPKKTKEFWALKNVSFEVKKGEVVGIIGRNGAGKSTLLKILARITEPTSGQVTMYGRVASMLEVGTGFNPELTGRENIYLNGAIIGMSKREIETKFNDIVEFSGVGKFLDTPVKHYSSGMYVRLAFAVAAHLDADILLVDEVLAVGDAEFQKKCLGKMSDLANSGRTVIFVSHNIESINKLCSQCILLSAGELILFAKTSRAISKYVSIDVGKFQANSTIISKSVSRVTKKDSNFYFTHFSIINSSGKNTRSLQLKESFSIVLEGKFIRETKNFRVGVGVVNQNGVQIYNSHSNDSLNLISHKEGSIKLSNMYDINILAPGKYYIGISADGDCVQDWIPEIATLDISEVSIDNKRLRSDHLGVMIYPCNWKVK